jgi:hypothetical protein
MLREYKPIGLFAGFALLLATSPANAAVLWDWSFNGEAGTFLTDGTATANVAASGRYFFQDFAVTSSAAGAGLGSVSGGQYSPLEVLSPVGTDPNTYFDWDGSSVTDWYHGGSNAWGFHDLTAGGDEVYVFGAFGNSQTAALAGSQVISEGTVLITVAGPVLAEPVPEPSTWAMMILGFAGVGFMAYRRRSSTMLAA